MVLLLLPDETIPQDPTTTSLEEDARAFVDADLSMNLNGRWEVELEGYGG